MPNGQNLGDMTEMESLALPEMTLRDWFAAQALIATASHDYGNDWGKSGTGYAPSAAARAYRLADAMLEARHSNQEKRG